MSSPVSPQSIDFIMARIAGLRDRLAAHPLYSQIVTREQLCSFMESHVFAVWDFMSLLKALQRELTCTTTPWVPTRWQNSRRFLNEIVLGEESDLYFGRPISHFELYLEAMEECGANTGPIRDLVNRVLAGEAGPEGVQMTRLLETVAAPPAARRFVESTFDVIRSKSLSAMAAAFTFGREDVIPDLFRHLIHDLNRNEPGSFSKYIWYLERHIEVDGEDHGPLSLRMVSDLCGGDEALWAEAAVAAEQALTARLQLWDEVVAQIASTRFVNAGQRTRRYPESTLCDPDTAISVSRAET